MLSKIYLLRVFWGGVFASLILAVDQLVKWYIRDSFAVNEVMGVTGSLLDLTFYKNTGIAFGIPFPQELLHVVVFVILAALLYYFRKRIHEWHILISLALIFGGALSNLIDRITLGYVVDYVSVWIFPVFNLADAAIVVGVIVLGWFEIVKE